VVGTTVDTTIEAINTWIDDTNLLHADKRRSCAHLFEEFKYFYTKPFLEKTYFVVLDELPKPDFPELRALGFSSFIDMPANGITYKDTYYILPHILEVKRVHFHELVHVLQYALDARYSAGGEPLDIERFVQAHLQSQGD